MIPSVRLTRRLEAERQERERIRHETVAILLADERIESAQYVKGILTFQTRMIHVDIPAGRYRIGRFYIEFHVNQSGRPQTHCIESGAYDSNKAPKYYYGGTDWFCFGSRNDLLAQLLREGEDLAAAFLMLEGFEHVNPEDYGVIENNNVRVS